MEKEKITINVESGNHSLPSMTVMYFRGKWSKLKFEEKERHNEVL